MPGRSRRADQDLTGGYNGFRRDVLEKLNLDEVRSSGYCFQIELKYRAHKMGFRVREEPIVFPDRVVGKSKMSGDIFVEPAAGHTTAAAGSMNKRTLLTIFFVSLALRLLFSLSITEIPNEFTMDEPVYLDLANSIVEKGTFSISFDAFYVVKADEPTLFWTPGTRPSSPSSASSRPRPSSPSTWPSRSSCRFRRSSPT